MKAVWIALIAVGVSLLTTFVALYAARIKAHGREEHHTPPASSRTTGNDWGSDGGCD